MDGDCCQRPGGLQLTKTLLDRITLRPGARVLDVGCGKGNTVSFLQEDRGLDAWGIDLEAPEAPCLVRGDAAHLPWEDGWFDAVLMECSLSCMVEPETILEEVRRVLRTDGVLLVTDLYTRGSEATLWGQVGRVEGLEEQLARLAAAGFSAEEVQRYDEALISYWAALVFEHGTEEARRCLGANGACDISRWGYYAASCTLLPVKESVRRWQLQRAEETVRRARKDSYFYRRHLANFDLSAGLASLPFTDGHMLAEQGAAMLWVPQEETVRIRTICTSGSSGQPKRIWFTEAELERTVRFFAQGMEPIVAGGRDVAILMSDDKPYSIASLLREGLNRIGVRGLILGRFRGQEALEAVPKGCGCIVGLPADVLYLARHRPELCPGSVLLSADYIPPALVEAIVAVWHCPVFCHYGMTETGYGLAVQCGRLEGQHLRWQDYLVEIIDPDTGAVLPDGCEGEIVLTSLFQGRAMPLIRYRTGDIGSLAAGPCGCGSWLPCLGPIRGRYRNLRSALNIHRLDDVLFSLPEVAGFYACLTREGLSISVEGEIPDHVAEELRTLSPVPVHIRRGEAPPWETKEKRRLAEEDAGTGCI